MTIINVPARLNVRLQEAEREAVAIIATSLSAPHRRPATVADAVRAALLIAADATRARELPDGL